MPRRRVVSIAAIALSVSLVGVAAVAFATGGELSANGSERTGYESARPEAASPTATVSAAAQKAVRSHRLHHCLKAHPHASAHALRRCAASHRKSAAGATTTAPRVPLAPSADTITPVQTVAVPTATAALPDVPAVQTPVAAPAPGGGSPVGQRLDVDPNGKLPQMAIRLDSAGDTKAAAAARFAGKYPVGNWFVGGRQDVESAVKRRVDAAAQRGGVATLLMYNIPFRDNAKDASAGGARTASEYRAWVDSFVAGLGSRKAIVIIEPDALMQVGRLAAADQPVRVGLLHYAMAKVSAQGSWAYMDVGNMWPIQSTQVELLKRVGLTRAAGFSLNVSNFEATKGLVARAQAVSRALPQHPHFVIDTSRNGLHVNHQWCNQRPAGLGHAPTTSTGSAGADAFVWAKPPGDSDGYCNGGPASGTFWPAYLEELVANAHLG